MKLFLLVMGVIGCVLAGAIATINTRPIWLGVFGLAAFYLLLEIAATLGKGDVE